MEEHNQGGNYFIAIFTAGRKNYSASFQAVLWQIEA
jgi:hypothetical protein